MKKMQSGFTLIELIAVIVILGILAATAVPRFISLQDDASFAAMQGVAGAIASASDLNVAKQRTIDAGVAASGGAAPVSTAAGCTVAVVNSLMREAVTKIVAADTTASGEYVLTTVTAYPGTPVTGDTATCRFTLDATAANSVDFTLSYVP